MHEHRKGGGVGIERAAARPLSFLLRERFIKVDAAPK